jgi:glycosyltransferase involved in cell wall biosynthesis
LVTTHPPGTGSLNEYAFHFVRALRRKPEVSEVVLLLDELPEGAPYPPDEPAADGLAALRYVPAWRFGAWDNAIRVRRAVRSVEPDAVLFNLQFATFAGGKAPAALGLIAPALVKRAGYPTLILLHNIMQTVDLESAGFAGNPLMAALIRAFGDLATRLLLQADIVALTIPKYVEILRDRFGEASTGNVYLIPHGAFDIPPPPSHDLPDGPLQIMTFGKFGTYKRVEDLITALKILRQGDRPPLEVVIAGSDSPNAAGYLDGVAQANAGLPGLRFTGYVPEEDVPRIFGESAVVVFPYTSTTGSSGVLHQAGEHGRAAVMPDIGDLAALVREEGYAAEFFEPGDAKSMADAIARVIDDPARRIELGERNYRAAVGLSLEDVVDWYLIHLRELPGAPA